MHGNWSWHKLIGSFLTYATRRLRQKATRAVYRQQHRTCGRCAIFLQVHFILHHWQKEAIKRASTEGTKVYLKYVAVLMKKIRDNLSTEACVDHGKDALTMGKMLEALQLTNMFPLATGIIYHKYNTKKSKGSNDPYLPYLQHF